MPKDDPRIAEVVVWTNGTVMVFDGSGEQMPEYQGMLSEVGRRLDDAFPATRWRCADWQRDFLNRPREAVNAEG